MKNRLFLFILLSFSLSTLLAQNESLSLSGTWQFKEDPGDRGISEMWYNSDLKDKITLPGSMNTNGKGNPVTVNTPWVGSMWNRTWYESPSYAKYRHPEDTKVVFWLSPDKYYSGAAWYQKKVVIPADWKHKEILFTMERCHWETTLWVDGKQIGSENSLSTPHRYVLSFLTPGEHTFTLRVDNRIKDINPGPDAHSVSDNTQSNWNGVVGEIMLEARPKAYISSVRIVPVVKEKKILAEIQIENADKKVLKGAVNLRACLRSDASQTLPVISQNCELGKGKNIIQVSYAMGDNPRLWDEFAPYLYTLHVQLDTKSGKDEMEEQFGMRELSTKGTQIAINGRPVFFRGTLECCIFPETGFPPTDEAEWERIMKTCRAHGLNHLRFHSWCPPKAAFNVADRLGFYFYVECGAWAQVGSGKPIDRFVMDESERIVQEYANHPSFCLFSYGNEPSGDGHEKYLTDFVKHWKAKDRRFLCTTAAGWPAIPENDWHCYYSSPAPRIQAWGEGIGSIINATKPGSNYDWTSRISATHPVISHEIGQWCVYPDLKERSQYTGVLKAKNFDIFEDRLRENGLLPLADSFLFASGKLQALCYKADIEAALRTKGFGGFQLLDLHDFPGQGTALVGVLNPFWRSKGYVTSQEFSEFCNEVVPLARMDRFILNSGETLEASIEIAQYSADDLSNAKTTWKLTSMDGGLVDSGSFFTATIPTGTLTKVGELHKKLETQVPVQYLLEVSVGNYKNHWHVWVYPETREESAEVKIATVLDKEALDVLDKGGKVLLTPQFGNLRNEGKDSVVVGFSSIFWNTLWTNGQAPHTLGILCDPSHPALSLFPTAYHSDYQWQDAMSHCQAIPLKKLGDDIKPIVRIIDDWFTARSFGMVVEMKVGKGKLLMCSADLTTEMEKRPEARQLANSLLHYMKSDAFNPSQVVTVEAIKGLYK